MNTSPLSRARNALDAYMNKGEMFINLPMNELAYLISDVQMAKKIVRSRDEKAALDAFIQMLQKRFQLIKEQEKITTQRAKLKLDKLVAMSNISSKTLVALGILATFIAGFITWLILTLRQQKQLNCENVGVWTIFSVILYILASLAFISITLYMIFFAKGSQMQIRQRIEEIG